MGQVLCMVMILCGGLLIWWKHNDRPEMVTESSEVTDG
jgi:prolipoprotein diacylglyceryltransferase